MVLDTRHGLLVAAGFTVLPVTPDLAARRRGPAKKKDDTEDARICCLLALDTYAKLRKLLPHCEFGAELRAIARDDQRAARDQRRLLNRLRADLLAVFPAALELTGDDLGAVTIVKLLERWPAADALAAAPRTARRLAYNHYFGDAAHQWAFSSLKQFAWAREFNEAKLADGKSHNALLRKPRALANRWFEIRWHCLHLQARYDEAKRVANR